MKEREETFERMFVRDEELKFRAMARRNKLLGLWAADKLGRSSDEALAYVREIIKVDLEEAGDEDVFAKIRQDFEEAGVQESEEEIRRVMTEFLAEAVAQVKSE